MGELDAYLREDLGEDDDSNGIVPGVEAFGRIVCKEEGVLAGLEEASAVFKRLGLSVSTAFIDGQELAIDDVVLEIYGERARYAARRTAFLEFFRKDERDCHAHL